MIHVTASSDESATAPPTLGERLDDLLNRFGARGTFARDAVLAVVIAVATLGLFGVVSRVAPLDPSLDLSVARANTLTAVACFQALLLCLRRTRPTTCLAAVVACQTVLILVAPDVMSHGISPVVAAYTFTSLNSVRAAAAAAALAVLAETAAGLAASWNEDLMAVMVLNHAGGAALAYVTAGFIGVYVATRRRYNAAERERAAEAIRAQRERAEAAIGAERTRIARELHDVAAHHLSGMVIQAAAVERLIGRDEAAAKSGAAWIRSQGKATLENLRLVVGLLRDRDTDDGNAPIPGMSALPALVDEARALGDDIVFERSGEALRLPPIADISLYRIAQQSLTNARQHAPKAPVRIRLAYTATGVALEITNGPSSRGELAEVARGGTGLVGMRERADLVGAAFEAGPTETGGWRVSLDLPVEAADAEHRGDDIEFETGDRT